MTYHRVCKHRVTRVEQELLTLLEHVRCFCRGDINVVFYCACYSYSMIHESWYSQTRQQKAQCNRYIWKMCSSSWYTEILKGEPEYKCTQISVKRREIQIVDIHEQLGYLDAISEWVWMGLWRQWNYLLQKEMFNEKATIFTFVLKVHYIYEL